ncbi:ABC transporter permease [Sporosarcina soli]|uniref:ABC transporter permease n=1 Tax=Sporosarcina soli TaxID=334736 RepID=A0ABW0TG20_9BACL
MRVLWNELKKILAWKMLLLLVMLNSVLYFFLIEFDIKHFPNGRPALDSYHIGIEMIEKYGTHMDEDEFLDFRKAYDEQVIEADQYLQSRREFVEAGFDTYEKFKNFDRDNEELYILHSKVMFEEKEVNTFWELQERERLIEFYDMKDELRGYDNTQQKQRAEELIASKKYGVYPEVVIMNFRDFIGNVTIAILFSVVLVISPMILKDRSRQMLALQYTSKKGRNLFKTKILAGLISTFSVITALLIVYFGVYSLNDTSMYFDVPVNTFIGNESWYDPTFFQYILLCVAAIYVIGVVFGLLAMSFSSFVPNSMALIGIQIPFIVGMIIVIGGPLMRYIISIWNPQWLAPTVYCGMVVASVLLIIILWRRERKRDIVL